MALRTDVDGAGAKHVWKLTAVMVVAEETIAYRDGAMYKSEIAGDISVALLAEAFLRCLLDEAAVACVTSTAAKLLVRRVGADCVNDNLRLRVYLDEFFELFNRLWF